MSHAKLCKSFYSELEIAELKEVSKKIHDENDKLNKRRKYNPEERKKKYDPEKNKKKYNPEKRKEKYDPEENKKKYNPEERKKKYDPEESKKKYNPKNRHFKHKTEYNPIERRKKYKKEIAKEQSFSEVRIKKFRKECQHGPIFPCVCCKKTLFKRSVRILDKLSKLESKLRKNGTYFKYLDTTYHPFDEDEPLKRAWKRSKRVRKINESLRINGNFHLCWNCSRYLEKKEMPPTCFKNSLDYDEIPECLKLTDLEKQLIVKDLIFIKVRQLPKTRMDAINDRVVNVPIEDDDIIKQVNSLPRTEKNSGMVTVKLKRKLGMKNYHKMGRIRPEKIYEALVYLKKNHPDYKNINISNCDEWLKNLLDESEEGDDFNSDDEAEDSNDDSDANAEDPDINKNKNDQSRTEENMFNSVTCLLPEDPLSDVIGKYFFLYSIQQKIIHYFFY